MPALEGGVVDVDRQWHLWTCGFIAVEIEEHEQGRRLRLFLYVIDDIITNKIVSQLQTHQHRRIPCCDADNPDRALSAVRQIDFMVLALFTPHGTARRQWKE